MAVTLKDIAKRAGVSVPTVSLVLNGRAAELGISEAVAAKVVRIAGELRYRPNHAARATHRQRHGTIGLLCSSHAGSGTIPSTMLWALEYELMQAGQMLLLAQCVPQDAASSERQPALMRFAATDGLLLHFTSDGEMEALRPAVEGLGEPLLWLNCKGETDCIHPDDYGGAVEGTRRLIELGHRRIGFIGHREGTHYSMRDRFAGYADTMRAAGLTVDFRPLRDERGRAPPLTDWLSAATRPSAIFVMHEVTQVLVAAAALGLSIPRDLALMVLKESVAPVGERWIDMMAIPVLEVGRSAGRLILRQVEDGGHSRPSIAVPYTYHAGETLAAPA